MFQKTKTLFIEVRERLEALEGATTPEPTIEIPVVDANGAAVNKYGFGMPFPLYHELTVQQAFDALQNACGVKLQMEKGTNDTLRVYDLVEE
jgi:hypothetical protein